MFRDLDLESFNKIYNALINFAFTDTKSQTGDEIPPEDIDRKINKVRFSIVAGLVTEIDICT